MSNSAKIGMGRGVGYWIYVWLPVVLGMAVIMVESTEWFGSNHTSGPLRRIFEALAQAYDFIVLHVDPETARRLEPALDGRLQVVVAILAPGDSAKGGDRTLAEFTAFGCSVVPYEQGGGERRSGRSGLFGRAAAI